MSTVIDYKSSNTASAADHQHFLVVPLDQEMTSNAKLSASNGVFIDVEETESSTSTDDDDTQKFAALSPLVRPVMSVCDVAKPPS